MKREVAIIGDVHGNLQSLNVVVNRALERADTLVFVGDYINRGPQSAAVIDYLIDLDSSPSDCIFLQGNHEIEFLAYLEGGPMARFLMVGGAATLTSYHLDDKALDPSDYRRLIPVEHARFLKRLEPYYRYDNLLVTHSLADPIPAELESSRSTLYRVAGHIPQTTRQPRVTESYCLIDTGCGTWHDGLLTCYFWPSGDWIQK